jgi:hypothetical protein
LLYLYDVPENDCQAGGQPALEGYQTWLDGVALVLTISSSASNSSSRPDQLRMISGLLDRWNRLHPGRARRRHSAPLAVVVRWLDSTPCPHASAHAALEAAGFGPTLLILESSFRHVRCFPLNPPTSCRSLAACPAHEPLEWLDRLV